MPITDLIFSNAPKAEIGSIRLDASVSETHKLSAKATSFPVEDGSEISDHILINPKMLSIEGFITDTPVTYLTGIRDFLNNLSGSGERSKSAFVELERLFETKQQIEVITGLKDYKNMIIESLSFPRNAATGQTLRFSAELKQIVTTELTTIELKTEKLSDVNGSKDQASLKQDIGKQQTTAPTPSESARGSILHDLLKDFF